MDGGLHFENSLLAHKFIGTDDGTMEWDYGLQDRET